MYVNYNNKLILFLVSPLLTARGSSQYFFETIVNNKSESWNGEKINSTVSGGELEIRITKAQ